MLNYIKPIIERRYEESNSLRTQTARRICNYMELDDTRDPAKAASLRKNAYHFVECLLRDEDAQRILLYLPFSFLKGAPPSFRETYMTVWRQLLSVRDIRENFHFGDCFEIDARPVSGLERVVKCAHLTPWLLLYGYVDIPEIADILTIHRDDEVLLQSFNDTWRFTYEQKFADEGAILQLKSYTDHLPARTSQEPLYVSQKRTEWLAMRKHYEAEPLTPGAKLEGPFSPNIRAFSKELAKISDALEPNSIILVGGSKLKGYGRVDSDLDVWTLREVEAMRSSDEPCSPELAHILLNSVWLGSEDVPNEKLRKIADDYLSAYEGADARTKHYAIEKIESDLCLYRLLHKGYAFCNQMDYFGVTSFYPEMDGDCPFYSDGWRKIATMLYAKYAWL